MSEVRGKDLEEYRALMARPQRFAEGATRRTALGALFIGFVMMPGAIYMGLIAGAPAILGTWIGAFTYSPALAVLFLAIGAGAIFQVVYELIKYMRGAGARQGGALTTAAGLVAGLLIMYVTGLLVTA